MSDKIEVIYSSHSNIHVCSAQELLNSLNEKSHSYIFKGCNTFMYYEGEHDLAEHSWNQLFYNTMSNILEKEKASYIVDIRLTQVANKIIQATFTLLIKKT